MTWDPIAFCHLYNWSGGFIGDEGDDFEIRWLLGRQFHNGTRIAPRPDANKTTRIGAFDGCIKTSSVAHWLYLYGDASLQTEPVRLLHRPSYEPRITLFQFL